MNKLGLVYVLCMLAYGTASKHGHHRRRSDASANTWRHSFSSLFSKSDDDDHDDDEKRFPVEVDNNQLLDSKTQQESTTTIRHLDGNEDEGLFPFMVGITSTREGRFCAGTLLSENYVLTAKQCVDNGLRERYYVSVFGHATNLVQTLSDDDRKFDVLAVDFVDNEEDSLHQDLAILTISEVSLTFEWFDMDTLGASPVAIATSMPTPAEPQEMTVVGWSSGFGLTTFLTGSSMGYLGYDECFVEHGAELGSGTLQLTYKNYEWDGLQDDTHFCSSPGLRPCDGDAGGPALILVDGQWQQIGVASLMACTQDPAVYVSTAKYRTWIEDVTNNFGKGSSDLFGRPPDGFPVSRPLTGPMSPPTGAPVSPTGAPVSPTGAPLSPTTPPNAGFPTRSPVGSLPTRAPLASLPTRSPVASSPTSGPIAGIPTVAPNGALVPTRAPAGPTRAPSSSVAIEPTSSPVELNLTDMEESSAPTSAQSSEPTIAPSTLTSVPSMVPTEGPTTSPVEITLRPSSTPSIGPTRVSVAPASSQRMSAAPSEAPPSSPVSPTAPTVMEPTSAAPSEASATTPTSPTAPTSPTVSEPTSAAPSEAPTAPTVMEPTSAAPSEASATTPTSPTAPTSPTVSEPTSAAPSEVPTAKTPTSPTAPTSPTVSEPTSAAPSEAPPSSPVSPTAPTAPTVMEPTSAAPSEASATTPTSPTAPTSPTVSEPTSAAPSEARPISPFPSMAPTVGSMSPSITSSISPSPPPSEDATYLVESPTIVPLGPSISSAPTTIIECEGDFVVLDFDTTPDGASITGGTYVRNEWFDTYGIEIVAVATDGAYTPDNSARILDTSSPGMDAHLGSPNQMCDIPGPGVGLGGEPGSSGENCSPQGNVLIIQESETDMANDDDSGGTISFTFDRPAIRFYSMGLMDIDEDCSAVIVVERANTFVPGVYTGKRLGHNSIQDVFVDEQNVKTITLSLSKLGAIRSLSLCLPSAEPETPTSMSPNPSPIIDLSPDSPPAMAPSKAAPTEVLSPVFPPIEKTPGICESKEIFLDFEKTPEGTTLKGGDFVGLQWFAVYGISITASSDDGGFAPDGQARIYDTTVPGIDLDLGSPNEYCSPPGHGVGAGGMPGAPGENCATQGNVLIIQDGRSELPNDNSFGGNITFSFETSAEGVYSLGLMDLDGPEAATIFIQNTEGDVEKRSVEGLGDNSVQEVVLNLEDVKSITISFFMNGAVRYLSACVADRPAEQQNSAAPSFAPTVEPTRELSQYPSQAPSIDPTAKPTPAPSVSPSKGPSLAPTNGPSSAPSHMPSSAPTRAMSQRPSTAPSLAPSGAPTAEPTLQPSEAPSSEPTFEPTQSPSRNPSQAPSSEPTIEPTRTPSKVPSQTPSAGPTMENTSAPSEASSRPTLAPDTTAPSSAGFRKCTYDEVHLDFKKTPEGVLLEGGDYVSLEWFNMYGITVTASSDDGGFTPNGQARIFDTSTPGDDLDLGSPNEKCSPPGPGVGEGGEPLMQGENCAPQGNVLIIQDGRTDQPNDNAFGGNLTFCFDTPTSYVHSIGVMDIDDNALVTVDTKDGTSRELKVGGLGDNSVQDITIEEDNVKCLTMSFPMSGAVRYMDACVGGPRETHPSSPAPPVAPSAPNAQPQASMVPTQSSVPSSPTSEPKPNICSAGIVCIDFQHTTEDSPLLHGDYVSMEWFSTYGMTISASSDDGGFTPNGKARIYDTSQENGADPDLGSPNSECSPPGPGLGFNGEPGLPGENCEPVGNVLIIQESDKVEPDDNAYGGNVTFSFSCALERLVSIGLIDADNVDSDFFEIVMNGGRETVIQDIQGLGNNAVQDEYFTATSVDRVTAAAANSLGIRDICFCPGECEEEPPTPAPVVAATTGPFLGTTAPFPQLSPTPPTPTVEHPVPSIATAPDASPSVLLPPIDPPSLMVPSFPSMIPSRSPSSSHTPMETELPSSWPDTCDGGRLVTLDFKETPDGSPVLGGAYLNNEWFAKYGIMITAFSRDGDYTPGGSARVVDTSSPGLELDLGSPNQMCLFPGPGVGVGGEPGTPGENCSPQGNVLIIQEGDTDELKDDDSGGTITFSFEDPASKLIAMGVMDIEAICGAVVVIRKANSFVPRIYNVDGLGDNSIQDILFDEKDVSTVTLSLTGKGAIRYVSLCLEGATASPSHSPVAASSADEFPSSEPSISLMPSGTPTTSSVPNAEPPTSPTAPTASEPTSAAPSEAPPSSPMSPTAPTVMEPTSAAPSEASATTPTSPTAPTSPTVSEPTSAAPSEAPPSSPVSPTAPTVMEPTSAAPSEATPEATPTSPTAPTSPTVSEPTSAAPSEAPPSSPVSPTAPTVMEPTSAAPSEASATTPTSPTAPTSPTVSEPTSAAPSEAPPSSPVSPTAPTVMEPTSAAPSEASATTPTSPTAPTSPTVSEPTSAAPSEAPSAGSPTRTSPSGESPSAPTLPTAPSSTIVDFAFPTNPISLTEPTIEPARPLGSPISLSAPSSGNNEILIGGEMNGVLAEGSTATYPLLPQQQHTPPAPEVDDSVHVYQNHEIMYNQET